jgi:hypothetical protein
MPPIRQKNERIAKCICHKQKTAHEPRGFLRKKWSEDHPQYTMPYFFVATGICQVPEKPLCKMKASPAEYFSLRPSSLDSLTELTL